MMIKTIAIKFCLVFTLTSLFIWVVQHSDNNIEYPTVEHNTQKHIIVDQLSSSFDVNDGHKNRINKAINQVVEKNVTKDKPTETTIHIAPGKHSPYYHIRFTLTSDNTVLTVPLSERTPKYSDNNDYEFTSWGQFEVFVERDKFPIPTPHTERKYLILRMPGTNPDKENADEYITEKFELFKKIEELEDNPNTSIEVTIELNPYMNVLSENPLEIELSGRNIFFRQAHGRYIDYVGELRPD